jgi:hypothetical protein
VEFFSFVGQDDATVSFGQLLSLAYEATEHAGSSASTLKYRPEDSADSYRSIDCSAEIYSAGSRLQADFETTKLC